MRNKYIPFLFILIPIISLVVALFLTSNYQADYKLARDEYQTLEDITDSSIQKNIEIISLQKEAGIVNAADTDSQLEKVDFYSLLQENSDIVAWITVPVCGINYPIVQSVDNDYYLNHTVKNTVNSSGAIFLDYENDHSFSDMHTLIYGHNMKDNSMFGGLKKIRNNPLLINDAPYVYIFTPDGRVRQYQIFAMRQVKSDSKAYRFFTGDEYYKEYVNECLETSVAGINNSNIMFGAPLVTLSTCSGEEDRLLVHCILNAVY